MFYSDILFAENAEVFKYFLSFLFRILLHIEIQVIAFICGFISSQKDEVKEMLLLYKSIG